MIKINAAVKQQIMFRYTKNKYKIYICKRKTIIKCGFQDIVCCL